MMNLKLFYICLIAAIFGFSSAINIAKAMDAPLPPSYVPLNQPSQYAPHLHTSCGRYAICHTLSDRRLQVFHTVARNKKAATAQKTTTRKPVTKPTTQPITVTLRTTLKRHN